MRTLAAIPFLIILFHFNKLMAQPYVDPLNIRYTHAFKSNQPHATPFTHLYIGSDIPVKLKSGGILVLSPFFESWNIDSANKKNFLPVVNSIALPIEIIFPLNKKWFLNVIPIPRINGENINFNNTFQMGGIVFA